MQRPMLNPLFMHGVGPRPVHRSFTTRCVDVLRTVTRIFLFDVFFWRDQRLKVEEGSSITRVLHGIFYRLLVVPLLMVGVVGLMVYLGTHPPRLTSNIDPMTQGIYYDPVSFTSPDGTRLDAWFVPMVDAKAVLQQKDKVLRSDYPAVVLVHDHGGSRLQMLPLVRRMHDAGYIVLVPSLRASTGSAGATFGLREAGDVQAAIDLLRRTPGVDGHRIAILGIGTGANAAIIAATRDLRVSALILDHPVKDGNELLMSHLGPPQPWLKNLKPFCKWTFEICYGVDTQDLNLERHAKALSNMPVLTFNETSTTSNVFTNQAPLLVSSFLQKHLGNLPRTASLQPEQR